MSEHTRVIGKTIYDHIPYRDKENGFSWCKHCKKFAGKMVVCFNEGWFSDWMQVNCGHCNKAIWTCQFKNASWKDALNKKQKRGKDIYDGEGIRQFVKDNVKCAICKKPTNHYDCYASGSKLNEKCTHYWCSKKCMNKWDKINLKINKAKKLKGG